MDPLHLSFTPYPPSPHVQSTPRLNFPPPPHPSLSAMPYPAPMPTTSRRIQCNPSFNFVLLYPVYVCYIIILFVTDEATIKAKRFICFLKESRVTLSFFVKSKLVTVLSLFLNFLERQKVDLAFRDIMRVLAKVRVLLQFYHWWPRPYFDHESQKDCFARRILLQKLFTSLNWKLYYWVDLFYTHQDLHVKFM